MRSSTIQTYGLRAALALALCLPAPLALAEDEDFGFAHDAASVASLRAFRADVEANARRRTLALCQGYRMGAGLAVHAGRAPISIGEFTSEWARVMGHGLIGPISATFGDKATYLQISHRSSLGEFALFRSLYSSFLVRSLGFLDAAMHCLNTMDQNEINRFAFAIVAADAAAGGATQGAAFFVGGGIIRYLLRPLPYLWSASRALASALVARTNRATALASGAAVLGVAGYQAFGVVSPVINARRGYAQTIASEGRMSEQTQTALRLHRLRTLVDLTVAAYQPVNESDSASRERAMAELSSRLAAVQAPDREEWRARYAALGRRSESGTALRPEERAEFALLDVVTPQFASQ